jgi:uncharacterized integral membrane protein (TIGR00698 family)
MTNAPASLAPGPRLTTAVRDLAPGLAIAALVAIVAFFAAQAMPKAVPIQPIVIALVIGIILNPFAMRPTFQPGIAFAVKKLLRWAVALLGLRIALGEIVALGISTALLVVFGMVVTIVSGFALARFFGQRSEYGALAGAGTAVCGASAALATSTVLPNYPGKDMDVVFVVAAVNLLSTFAMLLYPPLCVVLGLDPHTTGVMLGATVHDVAQVVGAGYSVSETVGNTAVIVKLFRVFLLLPVVLGVGWWFVKRGAQTSEAKVPVPVFALVFLALCIVNSAMPSLPVLAPVYAPIKAALGQASNWGLLLAIAALGLGTSLSSIRALGWKHVATTIGTTLVILVVMTGGLLILR